MKKFLAFILILSLVLGHCTFLSAESESFNEDIGIYSSTSSNLQNLQWFDNGRFTAKGTLSSGTNLEYYFLPAKDNVTITDIYISSSDKLSAEILHDQYWKIIINGAKRLTYNSSLTARVTYVTASNIPTEKDIVLNVNIDAASYNDYWTDDTLFINFPSYIKPYVTYTVQKTDIKSSEPASFTSLTESTRYDVNIELDINKLLKSSNNELVEWAKENSGSLYATYGVKTDTADKTYYIFKGSGDQIFDSIRTTFNNMMLNNPSGGRNRFMDNASIVSMLNVTQKNGKSVYTAAKTKKAAICVAEASGTNIEKKYMVCISFDYKGDFVSGEKNTTDYTYPDKSRVVWLDNETVSGGAIYNSSLGIYSYDCAEEQILSPTYAKNDVWEPVKIIAPSGYELKYYTLNSKNMYYAGKSQEEVRLPILYSANKTNCVLNGDYVITWVDKNDASVTKEEHISFYFYNYIIPSNTIDIVTYTNLTIASTGAMDFKFNKNNGSYYVSFKEGSVPTEAEIKAQMLIEAPVGAKKYYAFKMVYPYIVNAEAIASQTAKSQVLSVDDSLKIDVPSSGKIAYNIVSYGTYTVNGVTAYYNNDTRLKSIMFLWYDAAGNIIDKTMMYGKTEEFIIEKTTTVLTDEPTEEVTEPVVVVADDPTNESTLSLITTTYPQADGSTKKFIKLGFNKVDKGQTRTVFLPYAYFGIKNYGKSKDYEAPVILHYNEEMTQYETVTGEYTGKGVKFVVSSFSPFIVYAVEKEQSDDDYSYDYYYVEPQVVKKTTMEVVKECNKDDNCPIAKFSDLVETAWYHDGIHYCLEEKYVEGNGNGQFNPSGNLTRAEFVTLLYNIDGKNAVSVKNPFKDVKDNEWYTDAINWASYNKIVQGYTPDSFAPAGVITREEMTVLMANYAKYKGENLSVNDDFVLPFEDKSLISDWAEEGIKWCSKKKIVIGTDNVFNPKGTATRAEAAVIIMNLCER